MSNREPRKRVPVKEKKPADGIALSCSNGGGTSGCNLTSQYRGMTNARTPQRRKVNKLGGTNNVPFFRGDQGRNTGTDLGTHLRGDMKEPPLEKTFCRKELSMGASDVGASKRKNR